MTPPPTEDAGRVQVRWSEGAPAQRALNGGRVRFCAGGAPRRLRKLDNFNFLAIPSVNKALVMQLSRCEYVERRENVSAIGKTHVALGLGLAACQRGMSEGFTTVAALVHELMEARDDRRLLNLQRQLPVSGCSSSTNWASCRCPPPGRNCSSRSSASTTNGAPSW